MKNLLKSAYYLINPPHFDQNAEVKLCYVFHVEKIHHLSTFLRLKKFCELYHSLVGHKAICTIMPASNPQVENEMSLDGVSESEYVDRIRKLESVAAIGYHGHFWKDQSNLNSQDSMLKGNLRAPEEFQKQFSRDLNWFSEHSINHNNTYSAGWWYIQPEVIEALSQNGFQYDFSFSQNPLFSKPYQKSVFEKNNIKFGEIFKINSIIETPYLFGCHLTAFPQDFVRNFNKLNNSSVEKFIGSVGAHDYDLNPSYTLRCLEDLLKRNVKFFGLENIDQLYAESNRNEIVAHGH